MAWGLYLFALFAGAASTALGGSNATMSKTLAQPITAGLIVQVVTVVAMIAVGLVHGGMRWPEHERFAQLPWWAWLGGLGATTILLAQLLVAQRIGASSYFALTVTAGMLTSIGLDHFGWMGFDRNPAHLPRLIGGGLMIAGVILVSPTEKRSRLQAVIPSIDRASTASMPLSRCRDADSARYTCNRARMADRAFAGVRARAPPQLKNPQRRPIHPRPRIRPAVRGRGAFTTLPSFELAYLRMKKLLRPASLTVAFVCTAAHAVHEPYETSTDPERQAAMNRVMSRLRPALHKPLTVKFQHVVYVGAHHVCGEATTKNDEDTFDPWLRFIGTDNGRGADATYIVDSMRQPNFAQEWKDICT